MARASLPVLRGRLPREAFRALALSGLLLGASARSASGWGLVAHRLVARASCESTPGPLGAFFRSFSERLSNLSLEPDTRLRTLDADEPPRHFFDVDTLAPEPGDLAGLPRDLALAEKKFGKERLAKEGILPWWIARSEARLRAAMKRGDGGDVLREAAYLCHYVADLHQPLHLTRNYDGQETGNDGVHVAFERFMIERNPLAYRSLGAVQEPPGTIDDPADWAIRRAGEVWRQVPLILEADRAATVGMKRDGTDYYAELEKRLGKNARDLLSRAAAATARLWMAAWVAAGKPDPARFETEALVRVPRVGAKE